MKFIHFKIKHIVLKLNFLLLQKLRIKRTQLIFILILICAGNSVAQIFFPVKYGDIHQSYFHHKYTWGSFLGGSGGDSSRTYNQIISDTLSLLNNTYFSYWKNNYYFLDATDNKLYILINNQHKLAVDFNKTTGGDTLFYDGESTFYYYKGISNISIMGKPRRMFWIDYYYEGHGPGGYYRLLIQNWGYKFLDSIGQYENYSRLYLDATGYSYSETKNKNKTYYVKNSYGTFILFESPTISNATMISDSVIKLDWIDDLEYETGYIVERRKLNENYFSIIANLPANSIQYFDYDIEPLQSYQYRIRTKVDTLLSDPKDTITISTLKPPTNLMANNTLLGKIILDWQYIPPLNPYYIVQRKMLCNGSAENGITC